MILIPPNKQWVQNNEGDSIGSLWASFNLDIQSNLGSTRVSPRAIITTDDITDLGVPVAFATFTDINGGVQYSWAVCGTYVFRMALANGYQTAFAKDSSTGTPNGTGNAGSCSSDESDMAIFGKDWLVVTTRADIYRFNPTNSQWNDGAGEITAGYVHMLCVYGTRFYVTELNTKVYSFTPANYGAITTSSSNTLNLANKGWNLTSITKLVPSSNRIWIPTVNQAENGCWLFAWDGATADDPNEAYYIKDASGILAGIMKDDVFWGIDNNGWLRYFNGGTMVKAPNGRLPIENAKFLKNSLSAANDRWIHPNGIDIVDGKIRILINNEYEDNGATIDENLPSGVWEYSPESGWIHIMSLSLYTSTITDYGQNRVSRVGALYANKTDATDASANGTMLMGAQLFSDATNTKEVILIDDSNDTLQKYGYIVTPFIFSSQIEDSWNSLYVRNRKLLDSADSITVKFRTDKEDPTEITITWTSTNTFTTTTNVLSFHPNALGYGAEVEVLQGKGSGKCAHITNIDHDNGTYTVTLDDTFTGATSGTAKVRIQKWKKCGPAYTSQTVKYHRFPIMVSDTSIQLKVCMQFKGEDEINDLILVNSTETKAE